MCMLCVTLSRVPHTKDWNGAEIPGVIRWHDAGCQTYRWAITHSLPFFLMLFFSHLHSLLFYCCSHLTHIILPAFWITWPYNLIWPKTNSLLKQCFLYCLLKNNVNIRSAGWIECKSLFNSLLTFLQISQARLSDVWNYSSLQYIFSSLICLRCLVCILSSCFCNPFQLYARQ